eukprot:CAMPEP_0194146414 /NCGR_PEP_ID=MMETSP0152-20130528/20575_1 /TAXON_ID=1049557 /ORGANISM="Thalassiothrix antarctica, Strain L6-D1" /LENGTH=776 /DNA_ID=CAMNT_0038846929 /DNA_START=377 /DNA_END=2707 /DNA_ORIENTATION=+
MPRTLPPPIAKEGKEIPNTVYTAKNFDTSRTASSSLLIRKEEVSNQSYQTCAANSCRGGAVPNSNERTSEDVKDDEEHLPAGQHLLVDMRGIEADFLNSEERLAHAMVEVVNEASLTLLSYHCHTLLPSGVSCVGVLLESHVSFHTWPSAGVITLDLFTCGSNCLLPVVPIIERLFGLPASPEVEPKIVWAHKLRGFRNERGPLQMWDLGNSVLGMMDMEYKKEVVSVQTKFQRIDVYDTISARFNTLEEYEKSLSKDNSYHSRNPELFSPDRSVFLGGVVQSSKKGEHAYHESLVHPALIAHANPQRVGIIGGGEGATLREVLKHNTIRDAIMIELDEEMVSISRKHLPDWSDCSDLVGSAEWCGDDGKSKIYYEDALNWFVSRYQDENDIRDELLDVIIMDAIDPEDDNEFSDALYNNRNYLASLYNSLSEDGILVIQVGQTPTSDGPPELLSTFRNRAILIQHLKELGFKTMHVYGQNHGGYSDTWNYLMAAKSLEARKNWYENAAQINMRLKKRLVKSKSGSSVLQYFDGSTMEQFQFPGKSVEKVFCRETPTPATCVFRGFDPYVQNIKVEKLKVQKSNISEKAGRGLFTTVDIPKGSYIAAETAVHILDFKPDTLKLITDMETNVTSHITGLLYYIEGYGFANHDHGDAGSYVDSSILTFINHGCKGIYNLGGRVKPGGNEQTANPSFMPDEYFAHSREIYKPVLDRNMRMAASDRTLRDITAGEEILQDYLAFIGQLSDDWENEVLFLRAQCNGDAVGDVTEYEIGRSK